MRITIILFLLSIMIFSQGKNYQTQVNKTDNHFFIENKGQWPQEVKYLASIGGMNTWITTQGVTYDYFQINKNFNKEDLLELRPDEKLQKERESTSKKGHVIKMNFVDGKKNSLSKASDQKDTYYNYFNGNDQAKWVSGVKLYGNVEEEIFNNINVKYYFDGNNIRYDYIVKPGADLEKLKIKFEGEEEIRVNEKGELIIKTSLGEVINGKLFSYQNENGVKKEVECTFNLNSDQTVNFNVKNYDKTKVLIIDPLIYSFFIGGNGVEYCEALAIDPSGNSYISGETESNDFPTTPGAYQITFGGKEWHGDAFITKINPTGTHKLYSTFFGGSKDDGSSSIVLDKDGNIYLAGATNSVNFPTTQGTYQTTLRGGSDGFISKFDSTCKNLLFSTFLGGNNNDVIRSICVDSTGAVYLAGYSYSQNYPVTTGAFQQTILGVNDFVLTKLNNEGNGLIFSTFIGGNGEDICISLKIDKNGNSYITGFTKSTTFPVSANAIQKHNHGMEDGVLFKVDSIGSGLLFSTYLGGKDNDYIYSLAIDPEGNSYLTGTTLSIDFPVKEEAFQTSNAGVYDVFVSKINPKGNTLVYSTLIGGEWADFGYDIQLTPFNEAVITGTTSGPFPVTPDALYPNSLGLYDNFVTKLNSAGTGLIYSTYFGGSRDDNAQNIILDNNENAYIAGTTLSQNFPDYGNTKTSMPPVQNYDAFVCKMSFPLVYLKIASPNGDDKLRMGLTKKIVWNQRGSTSIKIQYSLNLGVDWITLAESYPAANGYYEWVVPSVKSDSVIVKITDLNSNLIDISDSPSLIWDSITVFKNPLHGSNTLDFELINVKLTMNVSTPAGITATYYEYETPEPGILPSGIEYVSPYYWEFVSGNTLMFNYGYLGVPETKLRGVQNVYAITWLRRNDSNSAWENLGVHYENGNVKCSAPFSMLGQFALGSASPITSLKDEEIKEIKEIIINDYQLFQNYPNPFNPSTKIKYQIPEGGYVSLKVFDVLGREVAELVNEELSAGQYEVSFSPKFSSGIYFYKIQAGEYVATKKMIMLK